MSVRCVLVCTVFLLHLMPEVPSAASHIRLNNHFRFESILLSIEDESFVTVDNVNKLNGILAVTSSAMARATELVGRRISIEVARLLVPQSKVAALKAAGYSSVPATWESAINADVRLQKSGNNARAIPADECYGPNKFIQMPDFMINRNSSAYYLLREFAILRWGVLTEHNASFAFYQDADQMHPSICSINTLGWFALRGNPASASRSIAVCDDALTRSENRTAPKMQEICEFTETPINTGTQASILSQPVALFCDDSTGDSPTRHNSRVPNPHNKRCNRMSAAEVLRRHADFQATVSGATMSETLPTLLLVEASPFRNIVVVLDVSGSMAGSRLQNLIRSATIYIKHFAETGARLSIVTFNETVLVLQQPEELTDEAVRERVAAAVQKLVAKGWTNIADAITKAMEVLGATPPYSKTQTGFVLLITDGEHNALTDLSSAILEASRTSIVFDTVCISGSADYRMAQLAESTGGLSMFVSSDMPVTIELEVAFSKVAERTAGGGGKANLLQASTFSLPEASGAVQVDSPSALHFMVSLPNVDLSSVNFTATSPTGVVYGSFSTVAGVYKIDTAINTIVIRIPPGEIVKGQWKWFVASATASGRKRRSSGLMDLLIRHSRSTSSGSIVVVGESSGSNSTTSVVMDVWLRYSSFAQVTQASVQKIYAYITNSSAPLTGATVQATIVPSGGSQFEVALKDDGLGADLTANDGIYVGQILPDKMTSLGDYGVSVVMTSPVSRTTSAGKFRVESLATGSVTVPPGRVTDLSVTSSVKHQNVSVQFTSPGNQAYEGIPAAYEIRASNSFDQLTQNFTNCPLVGRPSGQPAGSVLKVNLQLSDLSAIQTNLTFFLAAAAVSTTGQLGEASFPMGGTLVYPAIVADPGVTAQAAGTVSTAAGPEEPKSTDWSGPLIAAVAVTGTIIVAEAAAMVVVAYKL